MILHNEPDVFLEFIQKTSLELGIQDIFVEKDYWVTYILKTLSLWDIEKTVVFKGGTSLSKAYGLIDRFSEDVDLVLKDTSMNSSQIKKKLKKIHTQTVIDPMKEVVTDRTSKGSRFRKIDCVYPHLLDDYNDIGDVSDKILVELNSFGHPFPTVECSVKTYIAEMLTQQKQDVFISKYELEPFSVEVLDFRRTFCEKIMGLLRVSLKKNFLYELQTRTRHLYDITKLLATDEIKDCIISDEFVRFIKEVYENDMNTPEFKSDWVSIDLSQNPLFVRTDEILEYIERYFNSQFKSLLYTRESFDFKEIKSAVDILRTRLVKVSLQ